MEHAPRYPISISPIFSSQLNELHQYISETDFRPLTADRIVAGILDTIYEGIAQHPESYVVYEAADTSFLSVRKALYKRWWIFFGMTEVDIKILALLDTSRHPQLISKYL